MTKLIEVGRPISALNVMAATLDDTRSAHIWKVLKAALTATETVAHFPDSWHLAEIIKRLEAWDDVDRDRLTRQSRNQET